MLAPYRAPCLEPVERQKSLDPWMLALLFAWVCDVGRIGIGLVDRRPVTGELGFAGLLGITTLIVLGSWFRKRRRSA
jgi:hypothetical protein